MEGFRDWLSQLQGTSFGFGVSVALVLVLVVAIARIQQKKNKLKHKLHELDFPTQSMWEGRAIHPLKFRNFIVAEIEDVSHNTRRIRFQLEPDEALNLPIGRHISVFTKIDDQKVIRSYTPITVPWQKGHFDLLVKVYGHGVMSKHIFSLNVGDMLAVRGPVGNFKYHRNKYNKLILVAAGSGITPMLQIIQCIADDQEDNTEIVLMYQNREERDILLRSSLEKYHGKRVKAVKLFLSKAPYGWEEPAKHHYSGYLTPGPLKTELESSDPARTFVCSCGPDGFNEAVKDATTSTALPTNHLKIF